MSEEPNTAAIRADWINTYVEGEVIHALCDALDATRAERDHARTQEVAEQNVHHHWQLRAAKAEAELARPMLSCQGDCLAHMDRLRHRAEAAEALKAKAYDELDRLAGALMAAEAQRDAERRMKEVAIAERERERTRAADFEAECSKQNDRAEDWKERHHRERERSQAAEARIRYLEGEVIDALRRECGFAKADLIDADARIAAALALCELAVEDQFRVRVVIASQLRRALTGGDQ